jgi:hypothetical protein
VTFPAILIAHRGNTRGPQPEQENLPDYIDAAISSGFQVEIDLWGLEGQAFLGHDRPETQVDLAWLKKRQERLWVHCKNSEAIMLVGESTLNWFFHENDSYTLTSHGFIWTYPGKRILSGPSVGLWFGAESPLNKREFKDAHAICGDYVGNWH